MNRILRNARRVALILLTTATAFASGANDLGIDLSKPKALGELVLAIILFVCAIWALWAIISGILDMTSDQGRHGHGIKKIIAGIAAAIVIGLGVAWINSLTGQNIQPGQF